MGWQIGVWKKSEKEKRHMVKDVILFLTGFVLGAVLSLGTMVYLFLNGGK